MKSKVISIFIALLIAFSIIQVYFYYKYKGNFIILIFNETNEVENLNLSIFIDGKKIADSTVTNNAMLPLIIKNKLNFGIHELRISNNEYKIYLMKKISVFNINWISIIILDEKTEMDQKIKIFIRRSYLPPFLQ